jgi:hypothetical protein
MLRCSEGKAIPPKATVSEKAILCEQEVLILGTDRLKIRGKGTPTVGIGDVVQTLHDTRLRLEPTIPKTDRYIQ